MKTFVKIALITAITVFALLGCEPGITDPHNEWWGEYNKQFDGSTYIGVTEVKPTFTITSSISTGEDKVNTVSITFPQTADVLKKDNPEAELKNFLSFWTFNPNTTVESGNISVLTELRGWVLQRRVGNQLVVDLKTIFLNSGSGISGIVVKIDGTRYTYSNGNKTDRDGNGITGEKDYDDYYRYLNFPGSTGDFVQPEDQEWTITLSDVPSIAAGTVDTTIADDLILASDNISGILSADKDTILKAITPGFKVEKFSNGTWSTHAVATYDEIYHRIIIKDNIYSHMTGYRVVFEKGDISLETEKEFFGVKQRIRITGGGKTIYNTKINVTRLEGTPSLYYNNTKRSFKNLPTGSGSISVYSKGGFDKNVVLRLVMSDTYAETISSSATKYYFKNVDLAVFKDNFKIYENFDNINLREIGITNVEFKRENLAAETDGANVIYITLDPAYKINNKSKTLLVGDGIGYASGIGVFSSENIWDNKGFRAYGLVSSVF